MKPYLLSMGAGVLVGVVYSLLNVRSPAPPAIALIGLLGILLGEQALPVARHLLAGRDVGAFLRTECAPRILGAPPTGATKPHEGNQARTAARRSPAPGRLGCGSLLVRSRSVRRECDGRRQAAADPSASACS